MAANGMASGYQAAGGKQIKMAIGIERMAK